eukprot:g1682.t1
MPKDRGGRSGDRTGREGGISSNTLASFGGRNLTLVQETAASKHEALFGTKNIHDSNYLETRKKRSGKHVYSGNILSNLGRRALSSTLGSKHELKTLSTALANEVKVGHVKSSVQQRGTYAVQNASGQWSRVGKVDSFLEKPITRKEILELERKFDSAIAHSKMTGLLVPSEKMNPILEQDVVDMRRTVRALYKGSVNESETQEDLLTEAIIAQKWTDLVFNEISASLGIGCAETGRLLTKIRKHYGNSYQLVRKVHSITLNNLMGAENKIEYLRKETKDLHVS